MKYFGKGKDFEFIVKEEEKPVGRHEEERDTTRSVAAEIEK